MAKNSNRPKHTRVYPGAKVYVVLKDETVPMFQDRFKEENSRFLLLAESGARIRWTDVRRFGVFRVGTHGHLPTFNEVMAAKNVPAMPTPTPAPLPIAQPAPATVALEPRPKEAPVPRQAKRPTTPEEVRIMVEGFLTNAEIADIAKRLPGRHYRHVWAYQRMWDGKVDVGPRIRSQLGKYLPLFDPANPARKLGLAALDGATHTESKPSMVDARGLRPKPEPQPPTVLPGGTPAALPRCGTPQAIDSRGWRSHEYGHAATPQPGERCLRCGTAYSPPPAAQTVVPSVQAVAGLDEDMERLDAEIHAIAEQMLDTAARLEAIRSDISRFNDARRLLKNLRDVLG